MIFIFCDFLVFYQIFLSPQVKQSEIISNKQGIYKLPNNLERPILVNWERSKKSQNSMQL